MDSFPCLKRRLSNQENVDIALFMGLAAGNGAEQNDRVDVTPQLSKKPIR